MGLRGVVWANAGWSAPAPNPSPIRRQTLAPHRRQGLLLSAPRAYRNFHVDMISGSQVSRLL